MTEEVCSTLATCLSSPVWSPASSSRYMYMCSPVKNFETNDHVCTFSLSVLWTITRDLGHSQSAKVMLLPGLAGIRCFHCGHRIPWDFLFAYLEGLRVRVTGESVTDWNQVSPKGARNFLASPWMSPCGTVICPCSG